MFHPLSQMFSLVHNGKEIYYSYRGVRKENEMPWRMLAGRAVRPSPSLDELVAETDRLLARWHTLSPPEMQRLQRNLDTLADYAERLAERKQCDESSDDHP
jgi:hypothetical protein